MKMRTLTLTSTFGLFVASAALAHATIVVATFADPSSNSANPLFSVAPTNVLGAWTANNLNLRVAADTAASSYNTYANTHMAFDNGTAGVGVSHSGTSLGAGRITFYTGANLTSAILTITFSGGAIFEPYATGASYLQANNVVFSGSSIAALGTLTTSQFAFSFANPVQGANVNTYTSSFTSSAGAVPEPMSLLGLGFAGFAALARRRKA